MVEKTKQKKIPYTVCDLTTRIAAVGKEPVVGDPFLQAFCEQAETLFEPKAVKDEGDWLACHEEQGQSFDRFKDSKTRNVPNKLRKKIYLCIADA
jgi:hypothetical protein